MLPKSKRLTTEEFKKVIEKGQSFHSPFLIARLANSPKQSRFSVSVPKKVCKNAVDRNKIRRRIYSIISGIDTKLGSNVVMIVKPGFENLDYKEMRDEIAKIFVKSSLLK